VTNIQVLVRIGGWLIFYTLFNGILNPKQLEGLRLLPLTPSAQQQFNQTADHRSEHPSFGSGVL